MPTFCMHSSPCAFEYKLSASVVLEALCPQQIAVDVVNDHDVLVAEARDMGEMPRLIGEHSVFKFIDPNQNILISFVGGHRWCQIDRCHLGGAYSRPLTLDVLPFCVSSDLGK
jgi:hypothetical protein